MTSRYFPSHLVFWMLIALFCYRSGYAQTELFSGKRSIGGFTGTAEYPFKIVDGDSIPDGAFLMYKSNVNALLKAKDSFFSFSGRFQEGFPVGFWKFQFGEFSSNKASQVVGYQYRVNVSGVQHDAFGNLSNGKPDGDWTYKISKIENSEVSQVLFKSEISYETGIPQKSFQIENDSITLVGRFLRNGFAHDIWSVYSDVSSEPSENWHFDNGLLEKIEKTTPDGDLSFKIFEKLSSRKKSIVLDERYLKLIKWNLQNQKAQLETENMGMYLLLQQNAERYEVIDNFFNDLGKSQFMPSFKVNVPVYPLDSLEAVQLQDALKSYDSGIRISSELLSDPQFGLLAHSNPQAQYYYQVVEKLQKDFLEPAGMFLGFYKEEMLEFLPRPPLAREIWPNGLPEKRIQVSEIEAGYDDWGMTSEESYTNDPSDIGNIQQMVLYAKNSLDTISFKLSDWLKEERKQQQFVSLEKQLVEETKTLERNVDTLFTIKRVALTEALNGILETKERTLKTYAEMPESDTKLDYGKRAVLCLKNLGKLAQNLGKLPEKELLIKETYQDAIWNPFTATIMDEDVKKRITSAYKNIIVPYLLKQIAAPLDCEEVTNISNVLSKVQSRLLELREEPTKKLERKLRKEQDPETILELLGVTANLKTPAF